MGTEERNNKTLGVILAIIGAIFGTIPWVIVEWTIGFYASILAAVIGYCALYGYKQVAKVDHNTKYIVIFATFIGVISTLFTNLAIGLYQKYGSFTLDDIMYNIMDNPEYMKDALISLGMGLLISLLSVRTIIQRVENEIIDDTHRGDSWGNHE